MDRNATSEEERFVRLEASRTLPGSGLGLSLASAVARLHGGSLQLADAAPGLRVTLLLPAQQLSAESSPPGVTTAAAVTEPGKTPHLDSAGSNALLAD